MASSVVVILLLAFVSLANCDFSCVDDKTVQIFGVTLKCPTGQVCDVNQISGQPCIAEDKTCQVFSCPENEKNSKVVGVNIGGSQPSKLQCPGDKVCNNDNGNCAGDICVDPTCPPAVWTCTKDLKGFLIGAVKVPFPCDGGTCNKDNTFPCEPCHGGAGIPSSLRSLLLQH